MKKTRREVREAIINLLYRHYVLNRNALITKQELLDNFQAEIQEDDVILYEPLFEHLDEYETIASSHLKQDWKFNRLNNYEKAVLIVGIYEISVLKVDKRIVINEMVSILKQYATNEDYKYVNKILDMIE